mmetsp:Transcript_13037/g.26475  ORF Transcript_13037/g.26475 Transcript_13037/m.26475 type:complete len:118 (+) Transcript_13037:97-450(+)
MTTTKVPEADIIHEPLLVQADPSPALSSTDTTNSSPDSSRPLASERQIKGAMWAGGIAGLLVGGPIGAGLGVWAGNHFAKKNDGDVGRFTRKAGDFTLRLGGNIKREWQQATSERSD